MLHFFKKLLMFRVGQKASKGFAHAIGLGNFAPLIGLIGGVKTMRRH